VISLKSNIQTDKGGNVNPSGRFKVFAASSVLPKQKHSELLTSFRNTFEYIPSCTTHLISVVVASTTYLFTGLHILLMAYVGGKGSIHD
jgi:hypothetical protein